MLSKQMRRARCVKRDVGRVKGALGRTKEASGIYGMNKVLRALLNMYCSVKAMNFRTLTKSEPPAVAGG